jgi:hypothetical protein
MNLLIAGDSFASFFTPSTPDYNNLESAINCRINRRSYGELIAEKLNITVQTSACPGGAVPMCVLRALKFISDAQAHNQPITHCIFHITDFCRITFNHNPKMDSHLSEQKMSRAQYWQYSFDKFFEMNNKVEYGKVITALQSSDFDAGNLALNDTDNLTRYISDIPIAKILSDNFAYLSLLESCCSLNNIKLMFFSLSINTRYLYSDMGYRPSYAMHHQPVKSWADYVDKQQLEKYNFDRSQIVLLRPGNHLYASEHSEVAENMLENCPEFFK